MRSAAKPSPSSTRHKAKPFFLYLAFNAVHTPMHATDERLKKFKGIKDNQRALTPR